WKFSPNPSADGKKRDMEWESPWGKGFPGWHIECSAMSRKHLGEQIDIHTGGADLIPVHHTNEIAQSEASSGKSPFVRFWVHGQFFLVDGQKMAKSKGNFYRLSDIEAKGFDVLSLRYFYLTAHYQTFLNFTWEGLTAAQNSLTELKRQMSRFRFDKRNALASEKLEKIDAFREKFDAAIADNLNTPQALAVVWEVVKSNIPAPDKYDLLIDFDEVLGLKLNEVGNVPVEEIPAEIQALAKKREQLRVGKKFSEADTIRKEIESKGYILQDSPTGALIFRS
ncbi:MAG: class I tRNA ligase family protein, partial [Candidatus Gottesmanbacteria bacterium]|nr:class I tRNA ligase family protein [Candidatus Gottesmanbacteria bacterium]